MMLGSDALLWGDSDVFIETFGAIRSGRFFDHDPHRTLLYPYFLTAFLIWSGEPPMDQIIVGAQHLLGSPDGSVPLPRVPARVRFRVALAGALILTVHTTQLFYEVSILSEVFFGVCWRSVSTDDVICGRATRCAAPSFTRRAVRVLTDDRPGRGMVFPGAARVEPGGSWRSGAAARRLPAR